MDRFCLFRKPWLSNKRRGAANMAGKYSGVQKQIIEKCEFTIFVPCAAHSLNLVGVQAAVTYFQLGQKLFNLFHLQIKDRKLCQRTIQ